MIERVPQGTRILRSALPKARIGVENYYYYSLWGVAIVQGNLYRSESSLSIPLGGIERARTARVHRLSMTAGSPVLSRAVRRLMRKRDHVLVRKLVPVGVACTGRIKKCPGRGRRSSGNTPETCVSDEHVESSDSRGATDSTKNRLFLVRNVNAT